ncbi:hypothetical protein PG995_010451 [Apiospora arundinis]
MIHSSILFRRTGDTAATCQAVHHRVEMGDELIAALPRQVLPHHHAQDPNLVAMRGHGVCRHDPTADAP